MREEDKVAPENIEVESICEGGNLDCGSGLLLLIKKSMKEVSPGGILEIRSTEISVKEDLPAWCRMTENPYQGWRGADDHNKYFVLKGGSATGQAQDELDEEKARRYRWQCRVSWSEGLTSKVYCRNHSWIVGQPASFDVQDQAPSAVEYVLGGLGSCLAMGFQIHASRRGVEIDQVEVSLNVGIDNIFVFLGVEDEGHSGFRDIQATLYVDSEAEEEVLREIWEDAISRSPVANTLLQQVDLQLEFRTI